ncbi:hypothetical protein A3B40_02460 [Candidatus Roizmanbacteria bacterium RIFCSPLOWO2_01_FULL_37_16]|uniref:Camelysin metallo-endopeptidase n=1 Tax=Candidatus Roizmanbacteria bacterium RIFCSPLOWO2_01_FULL_37_16 TaxID=1802058 RepID=A0A1F7IMQ7_9BACT|nr:MAG: hypothetical protein A3D79_00355 [Candidatus Daviesbacteria bacterium RIFCSPHIGHO2_02_FULL_39_8]OGK32200.1 MAG: hypothetical protein A3F57_01400 [Candidatus Roizmanbacteria bacterium RIFCSPHIGHO2_12_FULL_36_11]OGK44659.1 MAG: hypothetical protein A3B40_02460 [Candidatus Roizmanbacteria bacterium RIFCSPLOWO2_01_FULL_37_16]
MNRQIVMGILSIFAVTALVGGATFALFSSQASNNENTFGAGTMQLRINGDEGSTSSSVFSIANAKPTDVFTQVIALSNTGSIAATDVLLTSINVTPSNTPPPNLGDILTLDVYDDFNGNGIIDGGDFLRGSAHLTNPAWLNISLGFGLAGGGGSHQIIARITFDDTDDNSYQGIGVNFNLNFQANQ